MKFEIGDRADAYNISPGDNVVIRSWDSMASYYDVDEDGDIKFEPGRYFSWSKARYCGKTLTVERVDVPRQRVSCYLGHNRPFWVRTEAILEHIGFEDITKELVGFLDGFNDEEELCLLGAK